MSRHDFIY